VSIPQKIFFFPPTKKGKESIPIFGVGALRPVTGGKKTAKKSGPGPSADSISEKEKRKGREEEKRRRVWLRPKGEELHKRGDRVISPARKEREVPHPSLYLIHQ